MTTDTQDHEHEYIYGYCPLCGAEQPNPIFCAHGVPISEPCGEC